MANIKTVFTDKHLVNRLLKPWLMWIGLNSLGSQGYSQESPPPWKLRGDAYIILSSVPKETNLKGGFISDDLKERYDQSFGVTMLVNYESSPVGPYKELLYIPGTFKFNDGLSHPSISKIYVSTMASVINGRKNWGIPKELADFEISRGDRGQETIKIFSQESPIAQFTLSPLGPKLPITSFFLPKSLKTLGQELEGNGFIFDIKAHGMIQLASLDESSSQPEVFPDVGQGKVLLAFKISNFSLDFPVPQTYQLPSQGAGSDGTRKHSHDSYNNPA